MPLAIASAIALPAAISIPTAHYALGFNGIDSVANLGNHASLANMPAALNGLTIDFWARLPVSQAASFARILRKGSGSTGFQAYVYSDSYNAAIHTDGDPSVAYGLAELNDNRWHHVALTYHDSGDRMLRIWVDGALDATAAAATGALVPSPAGPFYVGAEGAAHYCAATLAWLRFSSTLRWTGGFTPPPRYPKPEADVDTIELWRLQEGAGSEIAAQVHPENAGVLTNVAWANI